jgi:hypothetical protein
MKVRAGMLAMDAVARYAERPAVAHAGQVWSFHE